MTIAQLLWCLAVTIVAWAVGRLGFLLLFRRPAVARTVSNSYGEALRLHERDMRYVARFDNLPTEDDIPIRSVSARVAYLVDGVEYRCDVALPTVKGEATDSSPVIWYNPEAPERATGFGLNGALVALPVAGAIAIVAWQCPF